MKNLLNYKAFLFDMDGTLVSSEKLKGKALVKTCESFGGSAKVEDYKLVMGQSFESVRDHFCQIANISPESQNFYKVFSKHFYELIYTDVELTKGVIDFIDILKLNNKKIGVVTSANHWMVEEILKNVKLLKTFDIIVAREDVTNHKPAPDSYLYALRSLGSKSKETLIFEDSEAGIEAAVAAACDVIAVSHEFNTSQSFNSADRIIKDFRKFI